MRDLGEPTLVQWGESVAAAVSDEGLFEAARLASPILPQYHPKQLIEMLNAGHTRRVKAILLHVLRSLRVRFMLDMVGSERDLQRRNVSMTSALGRAASLRRLASIDASDTENTPVLDGARRLSMMDEGPGLVDYEEIDGVPPLPLYALIAADEKVSTVSANASRNVDAHSSLRNGAMPKQVAKRDDEKE